LIRSKSLTPVIKKSALESLVNASNFISIGFLIDQNSGWLCNSGTKLIHSGQSYFGAIIIFDAHQIGIVNRESAGELTVEHIV
jgi:hypothetical protein